MNSNPSKYFVRSKVLVSVLCVLCTYVVNSRAQEYKTVKDGVEYAEVTKEISGLTVHMNLLRLDLKRVRLDVHHALDAAIGTEKTSSIATRHGAFAAINAGFFRLDSSIWAGDSVGLLVTDKRILSESINDRSVVLIDNKLTATEISFGHLNTRLVLVKSTLRLERGERVSWHPDGINREQRPGETIIFTPDFGNTTLTVPGGVEIVVVDGKVRGVNKNGSNDIPRNGFVISAAASVSPDFDSVHVGEGMLLLNASKLDGVRRELFGYQNAVGVEDVTNGVPQLIKNSKIDITWEQEKASRSFVETRHPRTAVAKLKDGKFLMITVDGRSESSGGIGLQDLAEYLLSLGATDAMNLDGGGSTTMFLDGKVVNHPSDKEGERKISDAILVTLRKK